MRIEIRGRRGFRGTLPAIASALWLLFTPAPASAATLGLDFTSGETYVRGTFSNFGWAFDVSETQFIDGLGLFDVGGNGLTDEHQVGLWDSGGTLLASVVITGSDPLTASTSALGGWRFEDIPTLTLAPGSYVLGAFYPTMADAFVGNTTGISTAPGITYTLGLTTPGSETAFVMPYLEFGPGTTGYPAFFGPNVRLASVPEPASLALLGIAATTLPWLRRRRR